ncbi:MAG: Zn-dependent exopeptidase M28 [Candidatus Izimaplasma sp.]|nr:Zn-dependent exopeptidase M28 [Candidatus Izimaplasma bacterium]
MKFIKDISKRAFDLAEKIISEVGPRLAGSKSSLKAADILKEELNSFTNKVDLEEFIIHRGAFLGWIKIIVVGYFVGVLFLWLNLPIVTLAITFVSILILVLQFFFYKPFIDIFYPKAKGHNVVGYIEPKKEVKKQVIISGHHDSARIFNFLYHQPKLYNLRVTGSIVFVIVLLITSILFLFIEIEFLNLGLKILLSIGVLLTSQMWFFASKEGSPGAGDNLISSTMALEIGRYFSDNSLDYTRIIVASFDAEEEGLRGARAFAKKHSLQFTKTPTILLNADCIYYLNEMFFLTSDINKTVKLDEELAKELVKIAKKKGYKTTYKPIEFLTGGTDAGELAKHNVKATTLIAMPWSNKERASIYHTPKDTLDQVEEKAVEAAIDIFITYIKNGEK